MTDARPEPADRTPTSNPVLRKALAWGGVLAAIVLVVSCVLGLVFAGTEGLVSAIVGTLMAVVFMGITAASILLANRFAGSDVFVGAFFGIVLGGWLLKFIVFIVLVVDVIVVSTSRMPYTSDVKLPEAPTDD